MSFDAAMETYCALQEVLLTLAQLGLLLFCFVHSEMGDQWQCLPPLMYGGGLFNSFHIF